MTPGNVSPLGCWGQGHHVTGKLGGLPHLGRYPAALLLACGEEETD